MAEERDRALETPYLTTKQVAAALGLTVGTVREWIRAGKIRAVSLGSDAAGYRIPVAEVRRLLGEEEEEG